jgi:hypothetical protein
MEINIYDIKNNIKIGQHIFENVPNEIKPCWAEFILSRFDNYVKDIPLSVQELYLIIDNKTLWKESYNQFTKIRKFGLNNREYQPNIYLHLAELVAKVTYNVSGEPAPFDSDSGYHIPSIALKTAEYFDDNRLEAEVKSAILIFNRNKKLKNDLTVTKDFFLYKKIDDILWFDWDPIGVNDIAPRDEYQSYVPEILRLVKAKVNREEIAKTLYNIENHNMGMKGTIENCLIIADKILNV